MPKPCSHQPEDSHHECASPVLLPLAPWLVHAPKQRGLEQTPRLALAGGAGVARYRRGAQGWGADPWRGGVVCGQGGQARERSAGGVQRSLPPPRRRHRPTGRSATARTPLGRRQLPGPQRYRRFRELAFGLFREVAQQLQLNQQALALPEIPVGVGGGGRDCSNCSRLGGDQLVWGERLCDTWGASSGRRIV